jgi:AcrR family transcriptional regulator
MLSSVMTDAGFARARRPEQKQQRREAILTAAYELGVESGVRNVTLGGVAQAVGLAKSNIVRYFGTREEIFLELAVDAWREWEAATGARLREEKGATADAVVAALAETLAERPFFCDLLSQTTVTLEHNISLEAARTFKYAAHDVLSRLGSEVSRTYDALSEGEAVELVSAASVLAGTLYPIATPSPVLADLYAQDPDLAALCPPFLPTLRRVLAALARGYPALRADGD